MDHVFISYRRDDSRASAGRLYETLCLAIGADRIFKDVDNVAPGEDFVSAIRAAISQSAVVLVVIGPSWISGGDAGRSRLDDTDDFVRLELCEALRKQAVLVPVLVDEATMPLPSRLPEELRQIAFKNAVSLDHDTWGRDVGPLIEVIDSASQGEQVRPPVVVKANSSSETIMSTRWLAITRWTRYVLPVVVVAALVLIASTQFVGTASNDDASSNSNTVDDLVAALTQDDSFTPDEGACIADAVFDEYGSNDGEVKLLAEADSYEELVEGLPGFDAFFTAVVSACTAFDP